MSGYHLAALRAVCPKAAPDSSLLAVRAYMTISQAFKKIDWARHALTGYVVIDPLNPNALEYLDEAAYKALQRVCLSKDKNLIVVATPESTPDESPSHSPIPPLSGWIRVRALAKRHFRPVLYRSQKFPISQAMVSLTDRNVGDLFRKWGNPLHFWAGYNRRPAKLIQLDQFAQAVTQIFKVEGTDRLIIKLKIGLFAVNAYLSGNPVKDTRSLGVTMGIANGLPKFLPVAVRSAIRGKSIRSIRIWASILNTYKAIRGSYPDLPLESITAPPFKWEYPTLKDFVPQFWEFLLWNTQCKTVIFDSMKTYLSVAAGPNHKISLISAVADAAYWGSKPDAPIWEWLRVTGRHQIVFIMRHFYNAFKTIKGMNDAEMRRTFIGGKLATKEEAAGKLRVFAIVDYWTQTCMEPIHNWMFSILKTIPTDGTFDQEGAIQSLLKRGHSHYWCYDLKSATDMIPSSLYVVVMSHVMGQRIAELWMRVLTDRDFRTPKGFRGPAFVRYSRGQPMGALSSWASLAIVHHFVVQLCAKEAGMKIPFVEYRVLGDDIVIADAKVAGKYTEVCARLGIPIGLPKSFVSEQGFLNFANQSILGVDNISPVSLKEELQVRGAPSRLEMAHRLLRRGWTDPKVTKGLRLLFLPKVWLKEMRRSHSEGFLTPHILRCLRVLLGPNKSILTRLGVKSGALQAWFLALRPGGGLLAPFSRLDNPEFRAMEPRIQARLLREMSELYYTQIKQKDAQNLGSMKVFYSWVKGVAPEWGISASPLLDTIMTFRDSDAKQRASILLAEAYKLKELIRHPMVDIAIREGAVVRLMEIESEFPTLPDFRDTGVLETAHLRRAADKDIVTDAALIQLATFIERANRTLERK